MSNLYINEVKIVQTQEVSLSAHLESFGDKCIGAAGRAAYQGKTYEIMPTKATHSETSAPPSPPVKLSIFGNAAVKLGLLCKKVAAYVSPEIAAKYALIKETDSEKQRNIYKILLPKTADTPVPKKEGRGVPNDPFSGPEGLAGCIVGCCQCCAAICAAAGQH